MDYTKYNTRTSQQAQAGTYDQGLRAYMLRVYNYMAGALGVTGLIAYMASSSEALMTALFGNTLMMWTVTLAPLAMVIFLSVRIHKMSFGAAQLSFWVYSALMGLSLSTIFLAFTGASIAKVFFITASVFGAMSLYGYTTKKDLTGFGSFLFMGLVGIIIASLVNLIFLKSAGLDFAVSILGVLIFTGFTAYHTQQTKETYYQVAGNSSALIGKAAIMGALQLYLDFINLMIMLLRLMGDRR